LLKIAAYVEQKQGLGLERLHWSRNFIGSGSSKMMRLTWQASTDSRPAQITPLPI
jgi:hypothetical protein